MDKFAFVIHVTDSNLITRAFGEPHLDFKTGRSFYKKRIVERSLRWFQPFKCADIKGIKSVMGKEIEGFFVFCSLIPEQILNMNQKFVLQRVAEACQLAETLGAKIVGLGAYTAQVGRKGVLVAKKTNIPITIGTSYTIAIAIESTLKAAQELEIDILESKIAVVGATGSIGSIFSRLMANRCKKLLLAARNMTRLKKIADIIEKESQKTPILITDINKAVNNADIVIFSTNNPNALIKGEDIKPGTIICDISIPKNVSEEIVNSRKDILVIDGGIVEPPGDVNFNFYFGPAPGLAYACIAETMILTLERRFESYSVGANVSMEKVIEIKKLGDKHGFKLSKFRSFYGDITKERIETTKKALKRRFNSIKL